MASHTSVHQSKLQLVLESILFVADGPLDLALLAKLARVPVSDMDRAVDLAAERFQEHTLGIRIQRTAGAVQMVTAPEAAEFVERFLGVDEDQRLSQAALETLAIIAYKQPITRPAIESLRGVNCDRAVATLRARGLIAEVGRQEAAGRPYLYGTTFRFLEYFGLEKAEDLPPIQTGPQEMYDASSNEAALEAETP